MIRISGLYVKLKGFTLRDINLNIEKGQYFILVGPSAAGKTVLLETIAGLRKITSGQIKVGNRDITYMECEKRNIGIVYQDCALFPHLTVKENIIFGLKMRREKPELITLGLNRAIELLGVGNLLARKPGTLSGGEKQKVALARAIVTNPEILLLDEPLGALDPQTSENVRQEIMKLHDELGITIIHVTHNFEEAVSMGERMAVIGGGKIEQVGTPDEIFRHPGSEFVARFTMAGNVFTGRAVKGYGGKTVFSVEGAEFVTDKDLEGSYHASIRPEDILITGEGCEKNCCNYFPAVITRIMHKGSIINVTVSLPPDMICLLTRRSFEEMKLTAGQKVYISFLPSSVNLF